MNKNFYKSKKFVAKTLYGLENILARELEKFGAEKINILNRAVEFEGTKDLMYRANISLRTALRILVPVTNFKFQNTKEFYTRAKKIDWLDYIKPNQTFAIDSVVNSKLFKHNKYPALKLKDAIVDKIRDITAKRPDVNTENPDIKIHLHIQNNFAKIYLDSSGESLHMRGYRLEGAAAPLNEALAAGMILLTGWKGDTDFIDPMCGSGTLVAEAAMIAKNLPPNLYRNHFGFMKWDDFDKELFTKIKKELSGKVRNPGITIYGSDVSAKAIEVARKNIARAKLENDVILEVKDFTEVNKTGERGIIVTNPPYGARIKNKNLIQLYKSFGDILKKKFDGYEAWILSGDKTAIKNIGLRTSKKLTLYNGPIECKFHKFELYKGSRKTKNKIESLS